MRHSDILVVARSSGRDFRRHKGDGARVECARPDECAIRREGRQRVRAGSESAGVAREFVKLGFEIISTSGTADALTKAKIKVSKVFKIHEGRPNVLDRIKNGDINFIINTPSGKIPREHEVVIRNAALAAKIPIMTTVRAALASTNGIRSLQKRKVQVRSLQEYHGE